MYYKLGTNICTPCTFFKQHSKGKVQSRGMKIQLRNEIQKPKSTTWKRKSAKRRCTVQEKMFKIERKL